MKEDFLHYLWKHQLFSKSKLFTINHKSICVHSPGFLNLYSGPDFFSAKIQIDDLVWVGNVEVHINSSDWYAHHHEIDKNYDSVILHVVWNDDVEVFASNNNSIPTLELKNYISNDLIKNYQALSNINKDWIPCEKMISSVDSFLLENWKTRLYFEKLESKSVLIKELLEKSNNDYEAVLFQLVAKNFGLNINGEAFLSLVNSFDFSIVRKEQSNLTVLTSLLFGQAGFLEDEIEENYYIKLKKEYQYLRHKYKLIPISKNRFEFFRLRPSNFPTIRIALLAGLYNKHQNLFSKLLKCKKLEDFYLLIEVTLDSFWDTHFTFEKESKKRKKKFSRQFIDLLIINTIIPLKFMYLKNREVVDEDSLLQLIREIKPEKNTIISKFNELKVTSRNAFDSQALIQLKNNYCAKKLCLQCAIGNAILKRLNISF